MKPAASEFVETQPVEIMTAPIPPDTSGASSPHVPTETKRHHFQTKGGCNDNLSKTEEMGGGSTCPKPNVSEPAQPPQEVFTESEGETKAGVCVGLCVRVL